MAMPDSQRSAIWLRSRGGSSVTYFCAISGSPRMQADDTTTRRSFTLPGASARSWIASWRAFS
jgi:hypothetical protein